MADPEEVLEEKAVRLSPQGQTQPQAVQSNLVDLVNVIADRSDPILKLVVTWLSHSMDKEKISEAHQRSMTIIVATLVALIVFLAGVLTYLDKIDGSTFTFLLGLVVGYMLTFVREAVFAKKDSSQ